MCNDSTEVGQETWKQAFMSLLRSPWSVVASGEGQLRCFMHYTSYKHRIALLYFLSQLVFKEMRKTKQTCILPHN